MSNNPKSTDNSDRSGRVEDFLLRYLSTMKLTGSLADFVGKVPVDLNFCGGRVRSAVFYRGEKKSV